LRESSSGSARSARLWLGASAGGVTAVLVDSLLNFQFAVPPTLILLFTLLAVPFLLKADDVVAAGAPEGNSRARLSFRIFGSGLVLGLAALLGLGIARRAAADHALALGLEQERKGDIARVERHFRRGITQAPDDGRLHYGLARALYVQGQYAEALAEVLRAERTVADSHLEVLKARILDQMGYSSPALAAYRHALWLSPTLKSVHADIERLERK
jgi:tetratricopeptide (TPR) repeat protein